MEVKDFAIDSTTTNFFSCPSVDHSTSCMLTGVNNVIQGDDSCKDMLMCPTELQLSPSESCSNLVLNSDDALNDPRSLLFLDETDSDNNLLSSIQQDSSLVNDFSLGKSQSLESYLSVLDDKCNVDPVDLSGSIYSTDQIKQSIADEPAFSLPLSSPLPQMPLDAMPTFPMNFQCLSNFQTLPTHVYNLIIVSDATGIPSSNLNLIPPMNTSASLTDSQLINNEQICLKHPLQNQCYTSLPTQPIVLNNAQKTDSSLIQKTPSSNVQAYGSPLRKVVKKRAPVDENREKTFACDICDNKYYTSSHLKAHRRSHADERPYSCNKCDKTYRRPESLSAHQRVHLGIKRFVCDICGKKYGYYSHLNVHIKRVHKNLRPFECNVCGKTFPMGNNLRYHMRIHSKDKQHECDVCKRKFTYAADLQRHIRGHTGEKNHICDICGKAFSESGSMTRHKKQVHHSSKKQEGIAMSAENDRNMLHDPLANLDMPSLLNLSCISCSKTFDNEESLIAHMKETHTKVKNEQVKCVSCPRTFENLRTAKAHESRMHVSEEDQLKSYICDICNEKCSSKKGLSIHRSNHYTLEDNSSFTDISACQKEDGKFQCNLCDRFFCYQAGLVAHRFSHSKCRPYVCQTCTKTFKTKCAFEKHSSKCQSAKDCKIIEETTEKIET